MVASIVSATHFMPTQVPAWRDMAMDFTPYSSTSATSAGSSIGISRSAKACSEPEVTVEDLLAGSSPASASTPPRGAVPAPLAWRSTSQERSTPGPLPYQMAKTPPCFASGYSPTCCVPQQAVAARSSFSPGSKWMRASASRAFCFHSSRS
jgi:hypothetical protein